MVKLREEAQAYEPPQTKNIADLEAVSLDMNVEDRKGTDKDKNTFKYKVVVIDGEEYRVPGSVLSEIKMIMEEKPDLKTVKVKKEGIGLNTRYKVIELE